jgi:hypothetical protein
LGPGKGSGRGCHASPLDHIHSIGFAGTIMAAITGTLLVPVFFALVQSLREKVRGGPTPAPE